MKSAVSTTSVIATAKKANLLGEWLAKPFDAPPNNACRDTFDAPRVVATREDGPDHEPAEHCSQDLTGEVRGHVLAVGALQCPHPDRDGRVDVAPRDVAEEVRGTQQAETEGERDAEHADLEAEELPEDHRARAAEDQDHRADQLCNEDATCLLIASTSK